MFADTDVFGGFSVDRIDTAHAFYGDTLGMRTTLDQGFLTLHLPSGGEVMAYPKGDAHQPATFTILNFPVANIDAAVDELERRGVTFERYDSFEHDEKGIVRGAGGPPIAWFTDPAGNVLAVLETT